MSTLKHVDMYKNDKTVRRYSESFKLKVLNELSKGQCSKAQRAKLYGINSSTINEWIRKYDRKDLMNTRILVENQDEVSRLRALKKEMEQLKELLIRKDMEKLVSDSYLEVAAENLGYKNVEELKKIYASSPNESYRTHQGIQANFSQKHLCVIWCTP